MLTFLIVLLVIWAAAAIIGFVVKGLLWLGLVGLILFAITAVWVFFKGRESGRDSVED